MRLASMLGSNQKAMRPDATGRVPTDATRPVMASLAKGEPYGHMTSEAPLAAGPLQATINSQNPYEHKIWQPLMRSDPAPASSTGTDPTQSETSFESSDHPERNGGQ